MDMTTLQQFYTQMNKTCTVRRKMVNAILDGTTPDSDGIELLEETLNAFEAIVDSRNNTELQLDGAKRFPLNIGYEVEELRKDLVYLREGEARLYDYLDELQTGLKDQVATLSQSLNARGYSTFVSDRDGTVNNYCGRYGSSVQSVYNAVFLSRFSRTSLQNGVILTSAPLENVGIVDVSTTPQDCFVLAGSKGREYYDTHGVRSAFDIPQHQQEKLDQLNQRIDALLHEPGNEKFGLIGSGFQKKFGQSTLARQDIYGVIPSGESAALLDRVKAIVNDIDPDNAFFRIEDTGYDIEIILTVEDSAQSGALKDFSKADGVSFLDERLNLGVEQGANLICGDTSSDLPMVELGMQRNRDTHAVFVTGDQELISRVTRICPHAVIVTYPDALVCACNELSKT